MRQRAKGTRRREGETSETGKREIRGQKSEVRRQKTDDRSQNFEFRN